HTRSSFKTCLSRGLLGRLTFFFGNILLALAPQLVDPLLLLGKLPLDAIRVVICLGGYAVFRRSCSLIGRCLRLDRWRRDCMNGRCFRLDSRRRGLGRWLS